jgi:conjugative transfer signal peptidase TraF
MQTTINRLNRFSPLWALTLILLVAPLLVKELNVGLNMTSSMPIGLYKQHSITEIKRGTIVSACLSRKIAAEGKSKGFLQSGICPANTYPVIKSVIAVPGDHITRKGDYLIINKKQKYLAPIQKFDHNGTPLKKFFSDPPKTLKGYWLYGSGSPKTSWDSRYWGSVKRTQVLGAETPIATLHSV